MATNEELNAAAKRVSGVIDSEGHVEGEDCDEFYLPIQRMDDLRMLARECVARLAADAVRSAEEAERTKPVTDEWLSETFPGEHYLPTLWIGADVNYCDGALWCRGTKLVDVENRGHLLDLIRDLRGVK